jgi:hypothetical protein
LSHTLEAVEKLLMIIMFSVFDMSSAVILFEGGKATHVNLNNTFYPLPLSNVMRPGRSITSIIISQD